MLVLSFFLFILKVRIEFVDCEVDYCVVLYGDNEIEDVKFVGVILFG